MNIVLGKKKKNPRFTKKSIYIRIDWQKSRNARTQLIKIYPTRISHVLLLNREQNSLRRNKKWIRMPRIHTVGPANRDVPESAIAEQPSPQNPENDMLNI